MSISLKYLLLEITSKNKQDAALSYLKLLVAESPFAGRCYLAGGAVRDMVKNSIPKDLDVVVTGSPKAGLEFAAWCCRRMNNFKQDSNPLVFPQYFTAKFVLRGVTHDGVDLSDVDIECVAPRLEEYDGESRKPVVRAGTLRDDALRRDFSVNSLFYDLTTNKIIDTTGHGIQDIKDGIIRTTDDDADKIFSEDALRLLRAARQSIQHNWKIAPETFEAIKRNASKITKISSERITAELDKMLMTDKPDEALRLLQQTGLLKYVMPEAEDMVGVTQNKYHDDDVWSHTLKVVAGTPPKLITRLSALFHDIAKPVTKSVVDDEIHFYTHEMVGADLARSIMTRLKYPANVIEPVVSAVKNHMRMKGSGENGQVVSDKALRKLSFDLGPHLHDILDLMQSDNAAHSELGRQPNQIAGIRNRLTSLQSQNPTSGKIKLPVDGNDLMALGFKGPALGAALNAVKDAWFENPNITKDQALQLVGSMARK
jgi:poly(A) polymerase